MSGQTGLVRDSVYNDSCILAQVQLLIVPSIRSIFLARMAEEIDSKVSQMQTVLKELQKLQDEEFGTDYVPSRQGVENEPSASKRHIRIVRVSSYALVEVITEERP